MEGAGALHGEEEIGRDGDAGDEVLVYEGLMLQLLPLVHREWITIATTAIAVSHETAIAVVHPKPQNDNPARDKWLEQKGRKLTGGGRFERDPG